MVDRMHWINPCELLADGTTSKRSAAPSDPTIPRKRNRTVTRKWTTKEDQAILDYLSETIKAGEEIEKPTASIYYSGMILKTQLPTCDSHLLKNKVRNFKTSYKKGLDWASEIGHEVLTTLGKESFKATLLKKCMHYDQLQEIFGSIPTTFRSVPQIEEHLGFDVEDVPEPDIKLLSSPASIDSESYNLITPDNINTQCITTLNFVPISLIAHSHNQAQPSVPSLSTTSTNDTRNQELAIVSDTDPAKLTSPIPELPTTPKSLYDYEEAYHHFRKEVKLEQKLTLQKEQIQLERDRLAQTEKLEREKLDFERWKIEEGNQIKKEELKIRKLEVEAQVRVKELEVEQLKIQFELFKECHC